MPFTALIVDDEPLAREGLRLLLSEDPEFAVIHEAANGREAVQVIRSARPDWKTVFVDVEDICWIEAAENYVQLHTAREGPLLHVAMNTLERSLDPELFLRVHRSVIVNIRRLKELLAVSHGEYSITLQNGVRLQSGRMYHAKIKALADNSF